MNWNDFPRLTAEFDYKGLDATFLENEHLRILLLPEKGGDIIEFRDKHTDTDVMFHTDHNWQPPGDRGVPAVDPTAWHDSYPGGWQINLPVAGFASEFDGTPYGLHGETALIPWDQEIIQDNEDAVAIRLTTDLVRYPFSVERILRLPAGESVLLIEEEVTNEGRMELEYSWQHHIALGEPLISPEARLDMPAKSGVVEPYGQGHANNRLVGGEEFEWPNAPGHDGEIDLTQFPPTDSTIHDLAFATDLEGGWYAVTNPELDLGFGFAFPTDPFECVWYWQAFGGFAASPYFNRNYNVGLEPTTSYPASNIPEAQRENGTIDTLGPGESISATYAAVTYHGYSTVDEITPTGEIDGN